MQMLITIAASVLAFGVMILFHEFGHFVTAKLSGIQVNEFSIGMGPALLKKVYKGTQYSLRMFPVGGYVAMEGEDSAEGSFAQKEADARRADEEADEENEDPYAHIPREERTGKPFNQVGVPARMITIAAGACMNFVLAFLVLLLLVSRQDAITSKIIHSFKSEDALCAQTGLQAGDEIVAVNGFRCYVADDIVYELSRTPNYAADFTVRRGGVTVELKNVQFDTWQAEDGSTHMTIGFVVYGLEKTPLRVLQEAVNYERYYGRVVFLSLKDLITGKGSINDLSGPVGIVSAIGASVSYGLDDFLTLLALLSVNLGIMNLLPFPVLDGGKLVFILWEAVTHRPVPARLQEITSIVGFVLLLGLLVFATFNDIVRIVTGG